MGGAVGTGVVVGVVGQVVGNDGAVEVINVVGAEWNVVVSDPMGCVDGGARCGVGTVWERLASEVNDGGGIEAGGVGNEVEEGQVRCKVEGCPDKCSTGVGVVPEVEGGVIEN